jgi:FkbM family methyltransferase
VPGARALSTVRRTPELALLNDLAEVVRKDIDLRHKRRAQPDRVTLRGIQLRLDPAWASQQIRDSIYHDQYETAEIDLLARTLRPDDTYMEIGGGIGFVAAAAANIVGADRVHIYEANPQLARDTIPETGRLNGHEFRPINAVLGIGNETCTFYVREDFWESSLAPSAGATPVQVPQLDFAGELAGARPTYLMVDIEGGEVELLPHIRIPEHVRALCVEMHPSVVGTCSINDLIVSLIGQGMLIDVYLSGDGSLFFTREHD